MNRSILNRTCVLLALCSAALAGCGADSESLQADASVSPPDTAAPLDSKPDPFPVADAALDTAAGTAIDAAADAPIDAVLDTSVDATADTMSGATGDTIADTAPSLDFGVAASSIPRIADPQVPAADIATLASDNAAFAFAAYQKLAATTDNLVYSPASLSIALAMTFAGAAGTTASEMAQALHFTLPPARLHPAFNALDQTLASLEEGYPGADGGPMRLRIVNSLWAEETYAFKSDFLATLAANYGAGVNLVDFINAPDQSRITINDWVAGQTENKIQELFSDGMIDAFTRLVLTNAIYFNARWERGFDPIETRDGWFTLRDGGQVKTKFMNGDLARLPALHGTNFQAVSLPYANPRLSMVVVVPDTGQFSQVESSLDANALTTMVTGMNAQAVALTLPRFRIETGMDLVRLLKALGMTSAFAPGDADFSGMDGTGGLYIAYVMHKTYIDVGENGTEAAASTGVVMEDGGMYQVDMSVSADRPFLYFVRDQPTGAILFMGRVLDPSKT